MQKWARKMMHAQDRHSYLEPPAPASLKEATSRSSSPDPARSTPRTATSTSTNAPSHATPTFGEIPLRNDIPSANKHRQPSPQPPSSSSHYNHPSQSSHHSSTSRSHSSSRQAPFLSLEHLSLEGDDSRERARPMRSYTGEPRSAVDQPSRPHFPRTLSSTHQSGLHTATLPMGAAAPPPSGPLPAPPAAAGEAWRNQYRTQNMT